MTTRDSIIRESTAQAAYYNDSLQTIQKAIQKADERIAETDKEIIRLYNETRTIEEISAEKKKLEQNILSSPKKKIELEQEIERLKLVEKAKELGMTFENPQTPLLEKLYSVNNGGTVIEKTPGTHWEEMLVNTGKRYTTVLGSLKRMFQDAKEKVNQHFEIAKNTKERASHLVDMEINENERAELENLQEILMSNRTGFQYAAQMKDLANQSIEIMDKDVTLDSIEKLEAITYVGTARNIRHQRDLNSEEIRKALQQISKLEAKKMLAHKAMESAIDMCIDLKNKEISRNNQKNWHRAEIPTLDKNNPEVRQRAMKYLEKADFLTRQRFHCPAREREMVNIQKKIGELYRKIDDLKLSDIELAKQQMAYTASYVNEVVNQSEYDQSYDIKQIAQTLESPYFEPLEEEFNKVGLSISDKHWSEPQMVAIYTAISNGASPEVFADLDETNISEVELFKYAQALNVSEFVNPEKTAEQIKEEMFEPTEPAVEPIMEESLDSFVPPSSFEEASFKPVEQAAVPFSDEIIDSFVPPMSFEEALNMDIETLIKKDEEIQRHRESVVSTISQINENPDLYVAAENARYDTIETKEAIAEPIIFDGQPMEKTGMQFSMEGLSEQDRQTVLDAVKILNANCKYCPETNEVIMFSQKDSLVPALNELTENTGLSPNRFSQEIREQMATVKESQLKDTELGSPDKGATEPLAFDDDFATFFAEFEDFSER